MIRVSRERIEFRPVRYYDDRHHSVDRKEVINGRSIDIRVDNRDRESLRVSIADYHDLIEVNPRQVSENRTIVRVCLNTDKLEKANRNYETSLIIETSKGEKREIPVRFSTVRRYYIPSKIMRSIRNLFILALILGGVYYYLDTLGLVGNLTVQKLKANPSLFDEKIVTLSGYVQSTDTSHYPPDLVFIISDSSGKISVFSKRYPPKPGQFIRVTGKLETDSIINNRNYAFIILEAIKVDNSSRK